MLFSIHAEMMMVDAMDEVKEGVRVGEKLLRDVKFADAQGMVAQTQNGLKKLTYTVIQRNSTI